MAAHALELIDRRRDGHRHRHPWLPRCNGCGWIGIPLRSRRRAEAEYADHVHALEGVVRRTRDADRTTEPARVDLVAEEARFAEILASRTPEGVRMPPA